MAQKNNTEKILSVSKVGPPKLSESDSPSPAATAFTLPLTYFDTFFLKYLPTETLLFYQITGLTRDSFNSAILPKLERALSLTLPHYLPLAGHIMWPTEAAKPAVYYFPDQNDGVSVTVAESDADFNHLSCNHGIRGAVEFQHLIPQLVISDDKAEVIAIQITLFPSQGFCISIVTHHAVIDGTSKSMFERSWAHLCKELLQLDQQNRNPNDALLLSLPSELTPCFDRTLVKDPKGLDLLYANHWLAFQSNVTRRSLKLITPFLEVAADSKLVRRSFELTREDINKLRDKVRGNEVLIRQSKKEVHLSPYVLTCAYVYVCLVKAMGEEGDTTVGLRVASDCRSRLDPPLPFNYFGNCLSAYGTAAKASDVLNPENGIAFVADKLSDLVKGIKRDVFVGSEGKIVDLMNSLKIMKGGGLQGLVLKVTGTNRINIYGLDFGWGKPKKVEIVVNRNGAITLQGSRNGDGAVEVGVEFERQQMEVFASLFVNGLDGIMRSKL